MPDKLRSQINVGRIKVERERSKPIPNQVQTANSENRGQMDDSVETFSRTELKPWMRDVAKIVLLRPPPKHQSRQLMVDPVREYEYM